MRLKHLSYLQHVLWFTMMGAGFCVRRGLLEPGIGYPIMVTSVFMLAACWHILRPRYRDYIYEPKQEEELPAAARSAWDAYGDDFRLLGFHCVGNFKLQDEPMETYARFYLSDDPRIRGEVCALEDEFTPSFCSIFEDGRMIETAIHPTVKTMCEPDKNLWFIAQTSGSLAEIFERHQRAVTAYERETGCEALHVTPDRLYEFAQYGHRLVWWETKQKPRQLGPPAPLPKYAETQYASAG